MKKIFSLLLTLSLLSLMSSCTIKTESEKLLNDTMKSVENVQKEVKEIESDLKNAAKEVKEAKEALNKISN